MKRYIKFYEKYINPQTKTPEFKKWFGKSKVVDSSGNPLVVYHGTDQSLFKNFAVNKSKFELPWMKGSKGYYFASNKKYALNYGNNIIPCYLKMEKPYYVKIDEFQHTFIKDYQLNQYIADGYDGLIKTGDSKYEDEYVVFFPNQIKSAIGNNGNFDPKNNNINESV